jgi:hypothetical protein
MTERLSIVLREWIAINSLQTIKFQEDDSPPSDSFEDYTVKYEANFRPSRHEQAELAIVLTTNEYIGIGFGTRTNIAKRLNVRNMRSGYAAGFEPSEKSEKQLLLFLDLVRHGKIAILADCWPLFGLGRTNAAVERLNLPSNFSFGPHGWLRPLDDLRSTKFARAVHFEAWS